MTAETRSGWSRPPRETGVHLMEAFMYRHHPTWVAVRDLVAAGRIGHVTPCRAGSPTSTTTRPTSGMSSTSAVARCTTSAATAINLSRMLFDGEPTRVQASMRRDPATGRRRPDQRDPGFRGRDRHLHLLDADRDRSARAHLRHGRAESRSRSPSTSRPTGPPGSSSRPAATRRSRRRSRSLEFPTADPYTAEAEAFAAAVLDGAPTPVPPEDAVANLRVIEFDLRRSRIRGSLSRRNSAGRAPGVLAADRADLRGP